MTRGGLFHRLFLRFLAALGLVLVLLVPIVHLAQLRAVRSWQDDLRDQAAWVASGLAPGASAEVLAADWSRRHEHLRLSLFDAAGTPIADSDPAAEPPDLERAKHTGRRGYLAAAGGYGCTVGIERGDELGALIRAFDEMSRRLAEGERLQSRLLHDVSHELRSPLGRIQALAETVARHPEDAAACVSGIEQEVALLDRLVGDLLEAAHLESEAMAPSFREIELRAWAEETFARLGAQARSRGVAWTSRRPAAERRATGDPQRLAQAVANLVDNSLAALDGRPAGRIEVGLDLGASGWTLTVEDDGPGVPAADLPHVFRRFYRVQADRARGTGGAGLGLALVRAIARSHGGEAMLESRPGGGTTARLRVPYAPG